MRKTILALIMAAMSVSCGKPEIHHNLGPEEAAALAKEQEKPLCVVLVDHLLSLSDEYTWLLQEKHKPLSRQALFNIIDTEEPEAGNEIYSKWLCPEVMPLTCIFSPEGALIDLIPGMDDESFSDMEQALESMAMTEGRWPNRFGMDKAAAIPLLNAIADNWKLLSGGLFMARDVARLVDSLPYPYSLSLELAGQTMTGDTLAARTTARELLDMDSPGNLNLYKREFITAHKLLDPAFDVTAEPSIRVEKETVSLGELPMTAPVPLNIVVCNDGGKPLTISEVVTDCSCLRLMGRTQNLVVPPRDSLRLEFVLSPFEEGDILKNILLVSNAIDNPFFNIDIIATFKSQPL